MKRAKFDQVKNEDGEEDRRVEIKNEPEAKPEQEVNSHTEQLDQLVAFFHGKKDELLTKDHGVHPVHIQVVKDLAARKEKGNLHMSDGNKECVAILHRKLAKHLK